VNDLPKLPIGQQSFANLRERDLLYIDKTDLVLQLIKNGENYFLGRPRRMGKSLLVSLLQELFEGRRELFEGLAIAQAGYDFKPYPVIRLDFGLVTAESMKLLKSSLCDELRRLAAQHGIDKVHGTVPSRILVNLVTTLAAKEQVVLLIDEYDRPLTSNLDSPEQAKPYLDFLRDFYTTVKALQPYLRFTFITGVSRFARTSLFSGMNHLEDLSVQSEYAALLGVTEEEISRDLLPYVTRIAQARLISEEETRRLMRCWYNGYRFSDASNVPSVYNPHSLFSFLKGGRLINYWFSTGTPSFAIDLIRKQLYPVADFETGVKATDAVLTENFQLNQIDLRALLFQTGYLTISHYDQNTSQYTLKFPNEEVRRSFFESLMVLLLNDASGQAKLRMEDIITGLHAADVVPIIEAVNLLLGQISHHLQRREEAYYHSLIYVMLRTIGLSVDSEKSGCKGRLDMGLRIGNKAYIFEFKRDSSAAEAIQQIREKQYARTYDGEGLAIYLVGININSERCCIDDWTMEQL